MPMTVAGVDAQTVVDFAAYTGVTFPVMMDDDQTYRDYDQVGATAPFPLDVVIDKEGVVRYVSTRYEPEELTAVIASLLAE